MRRRNALLAIGCCLVALTCFVAGLWAAEVREEFAKLAAAYDAALLAGDKNALDAYYDADGQFIGADGRLLAKSPYINDTLARKWETAQASEQRVQQIGDSVVVETGVFKASGTEPDGKRFRDHVRYLAVWVKKDGKWVNVAEQGTPIVEAAAK